MDDWFSALAVGTDLPSDAAQALDECGFVVVPGPVPARQVDWLALAYDAAVTDAVASTPRHGSEAKLVTSCGIALPRVRAAMSTPRAKPRPRSNHEVISFIPTG